MTDTRDRLAALLLGEDFRDVRAVADRLIAAGVTFATPRPTEIDVERLARALCQLSGANELASTVQVRDIGDYCRGTHRSLPVITVHEFAERIAAAYAADPEKEATRG